VLYSDKRDVVDSSIEALDHAETLNPNSVLPPYLKGFIDERKGDDSAALVEYNRAISVDSSCYPAVMGKARILLHQERYSEAATEMEALVSRIPPDAAALLLLARARFELGNLTAANEAVTKALTLSPNSAQALILTARVYESEKDYSSALEALNKAEKAEGVTPETLLLRAKLQRERGNQAAAAEVLANGVKQFPKNKDVADAYGKILVETGQAAEGGKYLAQANAQNPNGVDSLEVQVTDAINSRNWKVAEGYVTRLLALTDSEQVLKQAYEVYSALGNKLMVLEYAKKLSEVAPSNGSYLVNYIRSLMSDNRTETAKELIAKNLAKDETPATMSSLYYLRSELQSDPALKLQDLRSALFENLENEDALISIARYYIRSGDLRSAGIYAQQAQAFLPPGKQLPNDVAKLLAPGD
ncbi:MAG TPA: tetratricopeptide repeat protein, partial [Spirochaetia bacterium]|nr:tetratricopeptide repeat protein [Spirochaetia bacterium]